MANKPRNRDRRNPRRSATRRPRPTARPTDRALPDASDALLGPLRGALRHSDPTSFWVAAAPLVTVLEDPGEVAAALPAGVDLLQTVIDVDVAETTALLHMVAVLSQNDLLRARAGRAVQSRRQPIPPQVSGLSQATITGAQMFGEHAGDNHMVELTLPGEVRATLVAYVTRIPHLYLKDAFVVGTSLDRVLEHFDRSMAADGVWLDDMLRTPGPARSRAALEDALAGIRPDVSKEPEPNDQWPMLRPFVDFVLSRMPAGGEGYDVHGNLT